MSDLGSPVPVTSHPTCTLEVRVPNLLGMHARPASAFVKLAGRFGSSVRVTKGDVTVNGKSIMGVLMLAAEQGSVLAIAAEGPDAASASEALAGLVRDGFGE